ncbi:hypothetical protein AAG906_022044 [Vitis piasezkii]
MGQQQSKDELLHQQVVYGNVEGIKALSREGAGLEWTDREGKTPLIVACMFSELFNVAKTLIELGANVNAYRPGRHAGTPLHHAAKKGLEETVNLLLSHGANALVMNDDCQTALDVARAKGHSRVVRVIESHICLFSGWLREFYGPGFLEVLAPQWVSRKFLLFLVGLLFYHVDHVASEAFQIELAIYSSLQDAQPRTTIALWKANMDEAKFEDPDPAVIILDNSTKTQIKLAPEKKSDSQQLQWFCNACKGIPQAMHPPAFLHNAQTPAVPPTAPPTAEDLELAMAINASIHFENGASTSWNNSVNITNHNCPDALVAPVAPASSKASSSECVVHEAGPSTNSTQHIQIETHIPDIPVQASTASAPPIADEVVDDGPVQYPSIDSSPVDLTSPAFETSAAASEQSKEGGAASSCVICLDAPIEGACIPCGHMAGCMSCLNEIKAKKWGCPVCRAKIDQVVKLYSV